MKYVGEQTISATSGNQTVSESYYFTKSFTLTASSNYSVTMSSSNGDKFISQIPTNPAPSLDQNFLRVEVPKVPVSGEKELTLLSAEDKATTYSYFDGLGRKVMTTAVQAGPDDEDLVQPSYYNETTGRQDRTYLGYAKKYAKPGQFVEDAYQASDDFYTNPPPGVTLDWTPFTEATYEDSPLNRMQSHLGVGMPWRNIEFPENAWDHDWNYVLNDPSQVIPHWKLAEDGNPVRSTSNGGNHAHYTLQIVESTNEEGIKTQSITDSRGRNIAVQTWYTEGTDRWITTYYVYDAYNRLRWILPPIISQKSSLTASELTDYAFQYTYDYRGRRIVEKNPGVAEQLYVYDDRNRLVFSQDGAQRNKDQWIYRKYDRYNRLIMTGLYRSTDTQDDLEEELRGASEDEGYEVRNDSEIGYTNTSSFPKSNTDVHTITYYDDYAFKAHPDWDQELSASTFDYQPSVSNLSLPNYWGANGGETLLGLTTGSKVRNLASDAWLNTVIYYDDEYRAIQVVSENHLGGHDRLSNQLDDYTGILEKMYLDHEGPEALTILSEYAYDHEFRLLQTYQQING